MDAVRLLVREGVQLLVRVLLAVAVVEDVCDAVRLGVDVAEEVQLAVMEAVGLPSSQRLMWSTERLEFRRLSRKLVTENTRRCSPTVLNVVCRLSHGVCCVAWSRSRGTMLKMVRDDPGASSVTSSTAAVSFQLASSTLSNRTENSRLVTRGLCMT